MISSVVSAQFGNLGTNPGTTPGTNPRCVAVTLLSGINIVGNTGHHLTILSNRSCAIYSHKRDLIQIVSVLSVLYSQTKLMVSH